MTVPHSCSCSLQQLHFGTLRPRTLIRSQNYLSQSGFQSVQRLKGCRLQQTCLRSRQVFCLQGKGNNTQEEKPRKQQALAPSKGSHQKTPGDNSDRDKKWGIFQLDRYAERWEVPWGGKELAIGMGAWAASFVLVGLLLAPLVVKAAGVTNYSTLTATDKSFLVLANQVAETVVGIAVINRAIGSFTPLSDDDDLLKISWRQPFSKPRGWLTWGLLGILLSPVVIGITVTIVSNAGYEAVGGQGTADGVARIISLDFPTYASLLTVTGVLAPFLEETVFRGFLLTTLTKWMPTPAAVVLSATAFGLAHLSPRDLPQLIALGTLLGFSYVRSRNLLTPMIIHGAWNSVVLTVLFALTASGVNVSEMLSSGG